MKIWFSDENSKTHRLVRLQCENHSNYDYLGDYNNSEIEEYFLNINPKMSAQEVKKNIDRLHYFGYLHLFVVKK